MDAQQHAKTGSHEFLAGEDRGLQDRPVVSVVVCVYNRPKQIVACIESLLSQDYRPLEIVLVDDGSTDETPRVLAQLTSAFRQKGVDYRLVTNPTNLGLCGARNAGWRAATGSFVLYTDSDCIASASWVSNLVAELSQPSISAVSGLVVDGVTTTIGEMAAVGTSRMTKAWLLTSEGIFGRAV